MDLGDVERIGAAERFLAVVATSRPDSTVQASVVNAGVVLHPVSGENVVGFVTYGRVKLANLRRRRQATLVWRSGWEWVAVEGSCDLIGPDDAFSGFDDAALPTLLRAVFRAAGGSHDNWDEFDRVMKDERRTAVLVHPGRIYSNRR